MPQDDIDALLEQVAARDRAAFASLYAQTSAKLFGILLRILGNRAEVEDAMQEIYVKIWERAAQFQADRGSGAGWIVTVARNHALDKVRARPGRAQGMQQVHASGDDPALDPIARLPDPSPSALRGLEARDDARRLTDCFSTLEPDRAAALRGAYLAGLSYQELAERHAIPLNTVRTWLRRGLQALRDCMSS